jgi:Fe-S oxidoreductase
MSKTGEEEIFEKALDCVRCGSCRVIYADRIKSMRFGKQCPPGTYHLIESFYPAGLMYLAVGLMREQFPYSPRAVEAVYACTLCRYCQTICEEYVETKTMPVIEALRIKAVREGVGPLPEQKAWIENLNRFDNILGQPKEKRSNWLKGFKGQVKHLDQGDKVSTLYFTGCQYSCNPLLEEVPRATAEVLREAGVDWGILGEQEKCCGYLPLALGYPEIFERYAKESISTFNRLGVKQIVTSCAECYSTFKLRYPEVAHLDAEVIHTTELFNRLMQEKRLRLKENKSTVTYHDPCHLGRYCNLYEVPRRVIQSVPGIELVEMERNRMDAWCCGAGGGVSVGKREYALTTARERLEEALSCGAEVLITSCPNCIQILRDAGTEVTASIAVQDIATFIHQSLMKR